MFYKNLNNIFKFISLGDVQLNRNIVYALLQTFIVMFCMFGSYKVFITTSGIEMLGVWSILMSGTSLARFVDVSGAGGLAKFVSESRSMGDNNMSVMYIHTVFRTSFFINLFVSIIIYALSDLIINNYLDESMQTLIKKVLPIVLCVSIILPALSNCLCSALDGLLRTDLRVWVVSCSSIFMFGFVWVLVPRYGLYGFALSLIIQQLILIILSWLMIKLNLPKLGWLPLKWSNYAFKNSFGFGLKLQANAIASILSDPIAKILLMNWSGASITGHYELASKFIVQLRGLFVSAMQPLIAKSASKEIHSDNLVVLIKKTTNLAIIVGLVFLIIAILASPIYSQIMLDEYSTNLVFFIVVLSIGFSVNIFSVPLYYIAMGKGVMKWNLASQFFMSFSIITVGGLFAPYYKEYAVVSSILIGLLGGSFFVFIGNINCLEINNKKNKLIKNYSLASGASFLFGAFVFLLYKLN